MSITYTFAADCPVVALRGITCDGGVFDQHVIERKLVDVVVFATKVQGKTVTARVTGKPELEAALAAANAAADDLAATKRAALEAAVPGLSVYEAASAAYSRAASSYDYASERGGYPVREAAAADAADKALQAVMAQYPATALWRKIIAYTEASNYSKSGAGNTAKKLVEAGGDITTAAATMEADWAEAARRAVDNA